MNKYINIHSHTYCDGAIIVLNCYPNEIQNALSENNARYYTVGLHPWYISDKYEIALAEIRLTASNPSILAIGETGLDKLCSTPMLLQEKVFKEHIAIAEEYQKPLIIHCVKAYNELIRIKNELNPTTPWVIHGFRGNIQITKALLKAGFYFSYGQNLSYLSESLLLIPSDKLFLETDDKAILIEDVYAVTARLLSIELKQLQNLVLQNFEHVFLKKA